MQQQPVHTAIHHDYCADTGFCKRCGLHRQHVRDMQIQCHFSDNLVAMTHIRAKVVQEEDRERKKRALDDYIEKVRAVMKGERGVE